MADNWYAINWFGGGGGGGGLALDTEEHVASPTSGQVVSVEHSDVTDRELHIQVYQQTGLVDRHSSAAWILEGAGLEPGTWTGHFGAGGAPYGTVAGDLLVSDTAEQATILSIGADSTAEGSVVIDTAVASYGLDGGTILSAPGISQVSPIGWGASGSAAWRHRRVDATHTEFWATSTPPGESWIQVWLP